MQIQSTAPFFSILVVCLNPGKKLKLTIDSILAQSCQDYEVIIKDGGSTDGSVEQLRQELAEQVEIVTKADAGIYDAMNQAVALSRGKFIYFLNSGDSFHDSGVLTAVREQIVSRGEKADSLILYGNILEQQTAQIISSNPQMDAFGCYRNVPCHQACFYQRELLLTHGFLTTYRVRADYEQFLWCFFVAKAGTCYMDLLIADYEGGGFSETRENRKCSAREHREITANYMATSQLIWYRFLLVITLAPLRTVLAENKITAGIYNKCKKILYRRHR